jgi:hypothetical protein
MSQGLYKKSARRTRKMLKDEILAIIKNRNTFEIIGDLIGALSLFGILFGGFFVGYVLG